MRQRSEGVRLAFAVSVYELNEDIGISPYRGSKARCIVSVVQCSLDEAFSRTVLWLLRVRHRLRLVVNICGVLCQLGLRHR